MNKNTKSNTYQIDIKNNILILKTYSFKAEKGSMLHSGIYNRELTSSLASGALTLLVFLVMLFRGVEITALHALLAVALFAVFFVLFRLFVFYEESLEAVIDKAQGKIKVSIKKFIGKKKEYPLDALKDVRQEHIVITPENPDGIRVVEKIALQHGTVIPGFGETKEFYTVELEFKTGESMMIFSSSEPFEAKEVSERLRSFINA